MSHGQPRLRTPSGRPGFTLIEMLVVMTIIVVLAAMIVAFTPRLSEDQRTSRGAGQIQGWLLIAKQRAYRDQVPRGIRLVRASNNPADPDYYHIREMVYIERPEDLRYDSLSNPVRIQVPVPDYTVPQAANVPAFSMVFLQNVDLQTGDVVLPGDFLQMNTYEIQPYNVHRIALVQYNPAYAMTNPPQTVAGTLLTLQAADGATFLPIGGRIGFDSTNSFQIIRAPRPMVGEPTLQLPRDVVVDLENDPFTPGQSRSILPGAPSSDFLDIIFNPRGQIMGSNANGGKIILRVRNVDKPPDYGDQTLITIFTRTGMIAAFPVNNDPATLNDPFLFTRDGKASGM